uniref:Secreted protein n=1 Tax=Arundo donax TaxID=35708 RepID=A0A0A9CMY0_ARUDO
MHWFASILFILFFAFNAFFLLGSDISNPSSSPEASSRLARSGNHLDLVVLEEELEADRVRYACWGGKSAANKDGIRRVKGGRPTR